MAIRQMFSKFPKKVWFVAALFLIFHFLVFGMPFPPGALFAASDKFMSTQPGYEDFTSGLMTQQMVESNVSEYNSYLIKLLVLAVLNIVAYFLLFFMVMTLSWNYIHKGVLSLKNYWKGALFNLVLLLVFLPLMLLFYTGTGFFSQGSIFSFYFFAGLFCVFCIIALISIFSWLNGLFFMEGTLKNLIATLPEVKFSFICKLIGVFFISVFILACASWVIDVLISSENIVALLSVSLQCLMIAGLYLYVGKCVSVTQTDSKNKKKVRG